MALASDSVISFAHGAPPPCCGLSKTAFCISPGERRRFDQVCHRAGSEEWDDLGFGLTTKDTQMVAGGSQPSRIFLFSGTALCGAFRSSCRAM